VKKLNFSILPSITFPDLKVETGMTRFENRYMKKKFVKTETVTIDNISGVVSDEKVDVTITLNNGDIIWSNYKTCNISYGSADIKIPLDSYHGSTGSVIGDIMLCYAQLRGLKIK
jgi:hypothetical protein